LLFSAPSSIFLPVSSSYAVSLPLLRSIFLLIFFSVRLLLVLFPTVGFLSSQYAGAQKCAFGF
jgi:hypothetical protein